MRWGALQFLLILCLAAVAVAQTRSFALVQRDLAEVTDPISLPDAPEAAMPASAPNTHAILASDPYRPLTKHQKWQHFLRRTYAPATFVGAGGDTVYNRAIGGSMYCCNIGGWGQEYAATVADKETRDFLGNFLFPALLKQDPRYFPKRSGSLVGRAWYAATRVLVTRNDNGSSAPNYSEVLGVAFAKAVSDSYYPDRRRGWETANRILGTFQSDATSNLVREFWPEIRGLARRCTRNRLSLPDEQPQY